VGLILAVDQGSTKTAALVAAGNGEILGTACARGACHASDGMEAAMAAVRAASQGALSQAGASFSEVALLFGGIAGADWPHEYPLLEGAIRTATGVGSVVVVNDCIIARRAGTDCPWGAVLCAGTGLNAAIISPTGESYIFGYYINGEDHGGTALGRLSLRAVFAAESGIGPPTLLSAGMLSHFGLTTVDDLLHRYEEGRLGPTSELLPVLVAAVQAGDPVATGLVVDFGERLARYVTAGLRRFGTTQLEQDVVLSGGIFKARLPGLRETVSQAILAEAPRARIVDAIYEPVVGALLLAMERREGKPVSLSAPAIAESAKRHGLLRAFEGSGKE